MTEGLSIDSLKKLYEKYEVEIKPFDEERVKKAEDKYGITLPKVLKDYYLKIGEIEDEEMMAYHVFSPEKLILNKGKYREIDSETTLEGEFLFFAAEMQYVSMWAIKKEDLALENPSIYNNIDGIWVDGGEYTDAFLDYDYLLDFFFTVARINDMEPDE